MAIETQKLHLLLIQENWKFADDSFNAVIEDMDDKLIGIAHADSKVHWDGWQTGYSYPKGSVVRTESCKSNQYYYCVTNGISGTTEPTNDVTGSLVTDGTVTWKVCEIGDSEGSASVDIFMGGMDYSKGQLVLYKDVLYRCKVAHVAASTMELDEDKWQQVDASLQPWKSSTYFLVDDIVVYDNVIYKCITAHTSGYTFDYTKWVPLTITLIEDWEPSTRYIKDQIVLYNNILLRAVDTHISDSSDISVDITGSHWELVYASIPEWNSNVTYMSGFMVSHNNRIYKCVVTHTSTSTFDNTKWVAILALPVIEEWQPSTVYLANQLVTNNSSLYKANVGHTSDSTSILNDITSWDLIYASITTWISNVNYKQGQNIIYNNKIYKCNANHLSGVSFDFTKWNPILAFPVIEEWQINTNYLASQVVTCSNMLLRALDNHTSDSTSIINDMTSNIHWELLYANIAPWQPSTVYEIGSQVIYNNNIYKCTNTHTSSSTFAISNWVLIGQTNAFIYNWEANKYYYAGQVVVVDKEIYRCDTSHTSAVDWATDSVDWTKISAATLIEPWASSTEYLVNQVVTINGILYKCTTAHTSSSSFDITKFVPLYATIAPWQASTDYRVGEYVVYNNQIYKCLTAHTSQGTFEVDGAKWQPIANNIAGIPAWANGVYYYQNQVVKYDGKIWRCLISHLSDNEEKPDYVSAFKYVNDFLYYNTWNGYPLSDTPKDFDIDIGYIIKCKKIDLHCWFNGITAVASVKISTDGVNFTTLETISCNVPTKTVDFYAEVRYIRITAESVTDYTGSPDSTHYFKFQELDLYSMSNKWEIIVDPDIKITYWQQNTYYNEDEIVIYNDDFYRCINNNLSGTTFDFSNWKKIPRMVIPDWRANENYIVNQVVFYDNKLYKCTTAHTSTSTFDITKWTPVNDTIDNWASGKNYFVNQVVWHNNSLWRCLTAHTSIASEAPDGNAIYTSTINIAQVDDTSTIPYEETIDLGDSYIINNITYTKNETDMTAKYYLQTSVDNITFADYYEGVSARYIKVIAYSVDINAGATSPVAYLDNFVVTGQSNKWQEVSTMNTLTSADIDEMFI